MHGVNLSVVEAARRWLEEGSDVWLITIVKTWGASPRPAGSLCAFDACNNRLAGSLSGGCVEEDLLAFLKDLGDSERPFLKAYGKTPEEQASLQLPCGGTLELLIEYLPASRDRDDSREHMSRLHESLLAFQRIERCVDLASGRRTESVTSEPPCVVLEESRLIHRLGPADQLLIIGCGDVTRYLVELAGTLEFDVTVCEPREAFLGRETESASGRPVEQCLPDDLVFRCYQHPYCAVIALAHDPRVDDLALIAALEGQSFYVGAMGSERTSLARRERLSSLGVPEPALNRLRAPIGLDIGSKTPPEIAISIAADLIRCRKERGY